MTVTDSDPERAADIANELIKQARIYLPEIMETETPNVVEDAVVPTQKSSPSYAKNTVLGALLGAVLCCGVLLVQYLMKDSFDTRTMWPSIWASSRWLPFRRSIWAASTTMTPRRRAPSAGTT